jgi:hypothetical protein
MNRLHIAFADNGGLAKVPLIVPEGQGGSPWVPETVQAAARVLLEAWREASAVKAHLRTPQQAVIAHMGLSRLRALAQKDTE